MDLLLLAARLALAVVFVVSGLGKLADRPGSRQAMIGFGVPQFLAGTAGLLLPLAELATAVLLIPLATAWWGGIASLVLLLLFVAGISVNLARGRTPDCHCFGQIHSEPIGWPTLARNGILALIAAFVIVAGSDNAGTSAVGWMGDRTAMQEVGIVFGVVVTLLIVAEAWFLLHLMQQNGRLLTRLEALETIVTSGLPAGTAAPAAPAAPAGPAAGLPVGSQAPDFSLSGLHGETMTLNALRAAGKPTLLIFSDPGCGPCNSLLPEIGKWQREDNGKLNVALVSRGTVDANRAKSAEHGLTQVLLQKDREVAQSYLSNGTPGAVVVRADGTIDSPLAQGAEQIRNLVARTVGRQPVAAANGNRNGTGARPTPPISRIGSDAPAVTLPDLDGKDFSLEQFRGKDTLLLFWNPGCGFCQRMLNDLKEWESNPPSGSPKLLIVSTGTPEANKALGLRSTTVLDQGFTTGRAFGASGTPSAVLVDARGKIASEVGVGAPAVLALAVGPADAGKRG